MPTIASTPGPALRLLPVPDCLPPYDDEALARRALDRQDHPGAFVQGTLALTFVLPSGVPAAPAPPAGLRLLPRPADRPAAVPDEPAEDDDFGPRPTSRTDLPDPRTWAARLVQALVEVLAGDRPAAQLVRWTTTEVYETVTAAVPAGQAVTAGPRRALVRSVHVTEPRDGVAEVAAVVRHAARCAAVALRIEGLDGRWQCTALHLG